MEYDLKPCPFNCPMCAEEYAARKKDIARELKEMEDSLLPCPLCGSKKVRIGRPDWSFVVHCESCRLRLDAGVAVSPSPWHVVERWNDRSRPKAKPKSKKK